MAKETQKQMIERLNLENEALKAELESSRKIIINQNSEILKLTSRADESFSDSSDYKQMAKKIDLLEKKNENLEKKLNKSNKSKVKNERGAGRKKRFTDVELATMKLYRLQGQTINEIAETYNCSVGLVHKVLNEGHLLVDEKEDYIVSNEKGCE